MCRAIQMSTGREQSVQRLVRIRLTNLSMGKYVSQSAGSFRNPLIENAPVKILLSGTGQAVLQRVVTVCQKAKKFA